jgi:hypothetical protein
MRKSVNDFVGGNRHFGEDCENMVAMALVAFERLLQAFVGRDLVTVDK